MSSLVVGLAEELAETNSGMPSHRWVKGERRVVLTLPYVTDRLMGPLNKLFSNVKEAFAYFGTAALMPRAKTKQVIRTDGTSPSDTMIEQITRLFPIGVGSASLHRDS
ncbi:MAG: hypothetical protein U0236_05420 [Nitrospira sp.]